MIRPFDMNEPLERAKAARDDARQAVRKRISCTNYLEQSKKGQWCCPFCGSGHGSHQTGALHLYDTNTWTCHACKKSGDVIDLYMKETGADYNTALSILAKEIGIDLKPAGELHNPRIWDTVPAVQLEEKQQKEPQTEEKQTFDYTEYYKEAAARLDDMTAVNYLQGRGISIETAKACNLGYDPAWISPKAIRDLEAKGESWRPQATARIIIPVSRNHYIARAIDKEAKYQKQNETGNGEIRVFNGKVLYGDDKIVFVTEGAFDALSIIEAGAQAIALNSTSNAEKLIAGLEKKPTQATLILCLDNDDAGNKATPILKQGLERLNVPFITANICGGYNDPNDALKGNREAFTEAIQGAEAMAAQVAQEAAAEARQDDLDRFLAKIQTEAYKPYKTGLQFFDDLLGGGVIRQTLLLLMAAPGAGKTTLCQQIAEAMAANGNPVIYLNFEMSKEQMIAKAISARLSSKGIVKSATDILQGYRWNEEEQGQITEEIIDYRTQIFPYLKYNPGDIGTSLEKVLQYLHEVGKAAKEAGEQAPVVVVDYLHLLTAPKLEIQELIKQAVTGLKGYAKDYDTFVIAIMATNRDANKGGQFTMESGRDSSNLEYTGDYMLSLNYYALDQNDKDAKTVQGLAELQRAPIRNMIIRVLKHRLGVPGKSAKVYFHAAGNRFYGENEFMPGDLMDFRTPFDETPF